MPPILFLVSAASSYRLLKFVAEHLVRDGHRVAFLYERGRDATFEVIERDAKTLGARVYSLEAETRPEHRSLPVWQRHPDMRRAWAMWFRVAATVPGAIRKVSKLLMPGWWRALAGGIADGEITRLDALRKVLAAQLAAARKLIDRIQPAVMVASDDGVSSALAVHTAARAAGVRVVVVPYGYGVRRDLEIALDAKAARGELVIAGGLWGEVIREQAPQWVKHGAHDGALMYPEAYILAAESLGITLRDSWIIHGGYADRLCVESEQMRRVYVEEGLPASKLALTGTPYCDVMTRAIEQHPTAKAALRQPRRITPGRTRVLVSWPPSYHHERGHLSEFATYREMSLAILGWLSEQPGCDVKVSLHPATLAADRDALAAAGIALTDEYVIEQIPLHDVFVTYFSSTIRWAIAAGKPAFNIDLYKLGLTVYDEAPGVVRVETLAEFQRAIGAVISSDAAFAAAAEKQIAVADEWGRLDGQNTARVAAEILAA